MIVPADFEAALHFGPSRIDRIEFVKLFGELIVVASLASNEDRGSGCILDEGLNSDYHYVIIIVLSTVSTHT